MQKKYLFEEITKDKIHPRSDHEGPERKQIYSCIISLTSAPRPGRFTPRQGTWYPLCWMVGGPQGWSGLGVENFTPTRIWSLDHPASSELLDWLQCPSPPCSKKYITIILSLTESENKKHTISAVDLWNVFWKFWITWTQWKTCLRTCHSEFHTHES